MKTTVRLALPIAALALTGCVSTKYKLAKSDTPPAQPLMLAIVQPPVEATLNTVIIYQGPGSWKREAYWDEYVLTVANRGGGPLTIESASLAGLADQLAAPGGEPWKLEKASRTAAEHNYGLAKNAAIEVGGGVGVMGVGGLLGAWATPAGAWGGAGFGAMGGAALALPVVVVGTIYRNVSSRHDIEREFQHRRLVLPATLTSGQIAQRSLFFPITPGPQRLTLRCRTDREPFDVLIDLAPLAGLHLKTNPSPQIAAAEPRPSS